MSVGSAATREIESEIETAREISTEAEVGTEDVIVGEVTEVR